MGLRFTLGLLVLPLLYPFTKEGKAESYETAGYGFPLLPETAPSPLRRIRQSAQSTFMVDPSTLQSPLLKHPSCFPSFPPDLYASERPCLCNDDCTCQHPANHAATHSPSCKSIHEPSPSCATSQAVPHAACPTVSAHPAVTGCLREAVAPCSWRAPAPPSQTPARPPA